MKTSVRALARLALLACACSVSIAIAEDGNSPKTKTLSQLKFELEVRKAELDKPLADLREKYLAGLERLEETSQAAGDLEAVIAVKKEIEAFGKTGTLTPRSGVPELARMQQVYRQELARAHQGMKEARAKLLTSSRAAFVRYQSELTKQGKIDEALEVEGIVDEIEGELAAVPSDASAPAALPIGSVARPPQAAGNLFLFKREVGMVTPKGTGAESDYAQIVDVSAAGGSKARWYAVTADGRIVSSSKDNAKSWAELKDVVAVSCGGGDTNLALMRNGTVAAWGDRDFTKYVPKGLKDAVKIDAGSQHALVLHKDGTVSAFGRMYVNQGFKPPPEAMTGVRDIAAGNAVCAVIRQDGRVFSWHSSKASKEIPEALGAEKIAARENDVIALLPGGKPLRWREDFVPNMLIPKHGPYTDLRASGFAFLLRQADGKWQLFANSAGQFSKLLKEMDGIQDIATPHANRANGFFVGIKR